MTRPLHPATAQHLKRLQTSPPHAIMLVGPTGLGKRTLAVELAEAVLGITHFDSYPYGQIVTSEDGKAIGIENVRQLEQFLKLKVPGQATLNRAVIIENADLLTLEAQNALLKPLEEPPAGTILILTVSNDQALLPTIRSRTQVVAVSRPDKAALQAHFASQNHATADIDRVFVISGGLPGLMHALLNDEEHPLVAATKYARQLLSQTAYERLLTVDELAKQRDLARDVTFILQQMAHVSLQSAKGASAKKWQAVLTASYQAAEALSHNAQPKLVLSKLMLNL